jgi:hypothetical protein
MEMSERIFVNADGKLIGVYVDAPENFVPPQGAIEVPNQPQDGRQKWDGEKWLPVEFTSMEQILALEAQITPRRMREALLGTDGGWLADVNAEIAALRVSL